jgi:hypothetical protein
VPLKVGEGLLRETFTVFRNCGQERNECVVYWAGPVSQPDRVDHLIHPHHTAAPDYYEVQPEWLNRIWFRLNADQVEIRVQVHTHRTVAFHSKLDDEFPLMQTDGFLSLVIPDFGRGSVGLDGAHLVELRAGGVWHEMDPLVRLDVK